jgi:hypothetical protein
MSMTNLPSAFPQLAKRRSSDWSSTVKTAHPIGQDIASRNRAQIVLLTFALLAAVFAATITLRVAVRQPAFHH